MLGVLLPRVVRGVAAAAWPLLEVLLYATFTQVSLAGLAGALRDRRFMVGALAGNFLLVPLLVWALVALLPAYLWLFLGDAALPALAADPVILAFSTLILLPLIAAWATGRWASGRHDGAVLVERLGWLPVPLLALVLFLIAAAEIEAVARALPGMGRVAAVFVLHLVGAALLGLGIARLLRLAPAAGTALIFSLGTRNSFVVLPLALALGPDWTAAAVGDRRSVAGRVLRHAGLSSARAAAGAERAMRRGSQLAGSQAGFQAISQRWPSGS